MILMFIHLGFVAASIVLIIQIINLQLFWKPDPKIEKYILPRHKKEITYPERGSILAHDGRLLAVSIPMYQIYMDCTVQKNSFANDRKNGKEKEQKWLDKAKKLSEGLAIQFKDKTAKEYYDFIASGRLNGKTYVKIGVPVNHDELTELKKLPLFNEDSYRGGLIVKRLDRRKYPYETLARNTIGHVLSNDTPDARRVGIEEAYNYILHGTEGVEWLKMIERKGWIRDYDSTKTEVVDGKDIRTTIDIDIQDIADKALRENILKNDIIEGGCAIVMDVSTGGIRAMVNLQRDDEGIPRERFSYATKQLGDPGSVFKVTTLMTLLEETDVTLQTKVPTFNGRWTYRGTEFKDPYLKDKGPEISVVDGFKISSNHVFRYLACKYFDDNPKKFIDKLYEYKLGESFDFGRFDVAKPVIPKPDDPSRWSGTALPSIAIGYSVTITPLHTLMLYNSIANKGKMMKPYIVESFEKDGKVTDRFKPVILNGAVCKTSTADSLVAALLKVTSEGTGRGLARAKCKVAGKTGTARIPFTVDNGGKKVVAYIDKDGNRRHQATFVGFFPAEKPKYTAIIVMYSKLSKQNLYGAECIPAFREIVNEIYATDSSWAEEFECSGRVPVMAGSSTDASDYGLKEIPSVTGLGLKDAIYTIENCGYRCTFEGTGHVTSQSPRAGVRGEKGETVHLILK